MPIDTLLRDDAALRIEDFLPDMVNLRRDIHQHPELGYEERRTSDLVAASLSAWGYEVHRGLGGTGVVGTLRVGSGSKRLGIRADMDALPIVEATGLPYASANAGRMHACGHDGHTTTLLTAARYLAETRAFDGTLHLIFQPAEEGLGGALRMIEDGLFDLFPCDAVFGFHNMPGVPAGHFCFVEGPAMASADTADLRIVGQGGHGAVPHKAVDPVVASASTIMALQSIVSRNIDPLETAVISIGSIHGGHANNVIPDAVDMKLTIRAFSNSVRDQLEQRIRAVTQAQAESFGATAQLDYRRGYPVLVNHTQETAFARSVAEECFGSQSIVPNFAPISASEDFAYMLERCPGCYLFIGNGNSASLHNPAYDFNDALLPIGARYWAKLAERYLV
ncbi:MULTISPECIES: M20 aminoacylase family protein [Pseudomonas]|uniref:Hippurate hydrolase n=2 Tax=Pseudomonas luteola TaxID=47886 RepID=A0A2X2D0I2_PSELU|nr:amidohydrolase [Pseudomonas sp. HPB0071]SHJ64440.1 hippurate hydrolase [Pseudomonas zeshuii]SPZ12533.1 hippurate hydrolase [Pseudomonas luteola]